MMEVTNLGEDIHANNQLLNDYLAFPRQSYSGSPPSSGFLNEQNIQEGKQKVQKVSNLGKRRKWHYK
jgi:hypothetical protein